MSVRLATRIGVVPEERRAAGSADVVAFREPTAGAELRTKGSLFALAQVTGADPQVQRAARQAVEWLEHEYYYDLSAGVLDSLRRALQTVNRRLYHTRARLRLGVPGGAALSVIAAVVRGGEAHVVRLGPAGGAILRDGRLYEIPPPRNDEEPDPRRRRRSVAATLGEALEVEPYTWQGEIVAADRLILVSRNLFQVVGEEELKRAALAERAASGVEELHRLFIARGGKGSDGLLVVEVVELPATALVRPLDPVYPRQPLAGLPDESPLPLAEGVGRFVETLRGIATSARAAAAAAVLAAFRVFLAFVPHRRVRYQQRVSRTAARRAGRRRRLGLAGMVGVAALVATGVVVNDAGSPNPTEAILRTEIAREAIAAADEALAAVETRVDGADLIDRDPEAAADLLEEAAHELRRAVEAGVGRERLVVLQSRLDGGLDRLYVATRLRDVTPLWDLDGRSTEADAATMVGASDGSLWILERAGGHVLRADPVDGSLSVIFRSGDELEGGSAGEPWLIASAATDVVIVDRRRQAWRVDLAERVPRRMQLNGIEAVDERATVFAALQHRPPLEIFTLYLVDPASGRVLKWTPPALIPVDFPDPPESYLTEEPDLPATASRDIRVDANLWLLHADTVTRVNFGTPLAQLEYSLDPPPDVAHRPALDYRLLEGATVADRELFYVYDAANARIVAFNRADGAFVRQWLAPTSGPLAGILDDVRGLAVTPFADGPPVAYLLTVDQVLRVVLE